MNACVWTNPNLTSPHRLHLARDAPWTATSRHLLRNRRSPPHLLLLLHAYIVGTNRPVLEDNAPTKATKTEIDKWIKANIKDRARLTKLEETAKGIDSIISTLKADKLDLPNSCRLTIAWGWDPKLAQSASQNALIRMLATANALVS